MLNFFQMFKSVNDSNGTNITYDKYFSFSRLSKTTANLQRNDFFLVHFNTRSLPKNLDKIEEFLNDMTRFPDAIAISETKLNSNSSSNTNIPHYNFLHNDSLLMLVALAFILKTHYNFVCAMTCRLICQTVRTYGYKSNVKCSILFLQLFIVIPTKKFHPFKIKFAIEFPLKNPINQIMLFVVT